MLSPDSYFEEELLEAVEVNAVSRCFFGGRSKDEGNSSFGNKKRDYFCFEDKKVQSIEADFRLTSC